MLLRQRHSVRLLTPLSLAVLIFSAVILVAQTKTVLYNFTGGADGNYPLSTLVADTAGNLYGTCQHGGPFGNGAVFKIDTSQSFSVIHSFGANEGNSTYGLVIDPAGNLYGVTIDGGVSNFGTIFKMDLSGNYSVLYNFDGTGGKTPIGPLTLDSAGNLYGTASAGGSGGLGTVFKLDSADNYSVLHSFSGGANDGSTPYSAVAFDASGNMFGTTNEGGATGAGTLYEIQASGSFLILHSFTPATDGAGPVAGVVIDSAGNLYGTAALAGSANGGTLFKYELGSSTFSVVHAFADGSDGSDPESAPIMDGIGDLYGTTNRGSGDAGTVYRIDATGVYSVVYHFSTAQGYHPGGLLLGHANHFYGVTTDGGTSLVGTVYQLDVPFEILTPAKHSTFSGASAAFTWTPESGATSYQIWLGSTAGADDLGYVGTSGTSATFTSVPTDGRAIYATLYGYANNTWSMQDSAIYTASTLTKARILSPVNGATFTSSSVTFTWSAETNGASYQLWLGSTPGTFDLGYAASSGLQGTVTNLPTDGRRVYATLWGYDSTGNWSVQDTATYTALSVPPAQITSPAKGSTLPGTVTFTWTAESGATSYQVWVGSSPLTFDITYAGSSGLSATVTGLPRDGRTLYVSLWGYSGGVWALQDTGTYTSHLSLVVMSLVLDRSGSMSGNGGGTALEAAVPAFISDFKNGLDVIDLISFGENSRIDVPITTNFQTPIDSAVASLVFDGGTFGTGAGSGTLWSTTNGPPISLADVQNNSVVLPLGTQEVKVMVYFTDGLMNTIQDMMACTNLTPVNTLYNFGGYDSSSGNIFDFFDPVKDTYETGDLSWLYGDSTTSALGTSSAGCGPTTGQHEFCKNSIPYNSTKSCKGPTTFFSQSVGGNAAFSRANITADAQYRALYTANQMRAESPVPTYIYVIGLGTSITGSSCTEGFLATLANDPNAPSYGSCGSYNSSQPAGGLFLVPDCPSSQCTNELNAAFQAIASKLL